MKNKKNTRQFLRLIQQTLKKDPKIARRAVFRVLSQRRISFLNDHDYEEIAPNIILV